MQAVASVSLPIAVSDERIGRLITARSRSRCATGVNAKLIHSAFCQHATCKVTLCHVVDYLLPHKEVFTCSKTVISVEFYSRGS